MWPTPLSMRVLELGRATCCCRACRYAPARTRPQREVQLAARGHVAPTGPPRRTAVGGGAGERLARVDHLEVLGAGAEGIDVLARAGAHVVLGVDVRRRAELARELDHVAAADLEPARLVQARAERDRRARPRRAAMVGAAIMKHRCATPRPHRPSWASTTACPTPCSCPRASRGGRGDLPRRRLGEGEPLRLRARLPRRGASRRSPTTRAATAAPTARFGPGAIDDALAMVELLRAHAPRVALRGSSMGGFQAIHAAARATAPSCAVVAICPAPEDAAAARPALGRGLEVRVRPRGHRAVARALDVWRRPRALGPRHRAAVAARAGRRAGALHGQRGAATRPRASRSAC